MNAPREAYPRSQRANAGEGQPPSRASHARGNPLKRRWTLTTCPPRRHTLPTRHSPTTRQNQGERRLPPPLPGGTT